MNLAFVKEHKCSRNYCSHVKYFDLRISKNKLPNANDESNRRVFPHVIVLAAMVCGRHFAKGFPF